MSALGRRAGPERTELALRAAALAGGVEDRRAVHALVASCPPGDAAAWDELVTLFEQTEKARAREVLAVWQRASWASRSPGATASVAPH